MGWQSVNPMEERARFVLAVMKGQERFSALCRKAGVSRKTGYKLVKRFRTEGLKGIAERSRRPRRSPTAVSISTVCEVVSIRNAHPQWGAKKIRAILEQQYTRATLPAVRSINRILERCGLVQKYRRRRGKVPYYPETVIRPKTTNEVWTVDFKGYWYTKDGRRCNPLTIRDEHSKFILDIGALADSTGSAVFERFKRCFVRYGLPKYIRSDNGEPFSCSTSIKGLNTLAVNFIKLGILPNRIPKRSPQYNGGHERMHGDMKKELQFTPARDLALQQRIFDAWRQEYNEVRPHEALKMKTPAKCYVASPRRFDEVKEDFVYSPSAILRKVGMRGEIWWEGRRFFLSNALTHETVGIFPYKDGKFDVWFREFFIGRAAFLPLGGGKQPKDPQKMLPMSWH
jgi:putative transposase